ncbi:mitochondrial inner membrane protease subunit 2 isoform X2 [Wyeomyia smithii]|uniref:mitochondrial inner membrane protease subunit 2 isoform X2 n=1 Tax=Wyeomyia smithii TaxID=174621 RepID=UPI002467E9A1|nr:mitochondrial inner membrane protease subunit 2 isoform X2 [Wyeomyia smithii]
MKIPLFFKSLLISIPVGVTFFDCVGYIARVEGISMQPALNPDGSNATDYVFLSRWAVRNMEVERGLQGDIIATMGYKVPFVKVPEGHCWIEGDHTGNSLDSNTFGPVSLGLVTARATQIVWPPSRWQSLPSMIPRTRQPITFGKAPIDSGMNSSHPTLHAQEKDCDK